MKNKQAAADYLGVSQRAVERYTQQGKLSVQYEPGKTRPIATYDEQELKILKAELERDLFARRPTVNREPNNDNPDQSLARLSENPRIQAIARIAPILEALGAGSSRPSVPISDKLILDVKEAQALTHFSRADLLSAIKEGKLKASKRGRGWKIKRAELDEFVKNI
jgi:excisionase family DNA binding protein